jgi:transcriptional regulator with XRE-family HTH domain
MIDEKLAKRLEQARKYLMRKGLFHKNKDLARIIGATESTISKALKGNTDYATKSLLIRFNNAFGNIFDIGWLYTGEGAMLKDGTGESYDGTLFSFNPSDGIDQGKLLDAFVPAKGDTEAATNAAELLKKEVKTAELPSSKTTDANRVDRLIDIIMGMEAQGEKHAETHVRNSKTIERMVGLLEKYLSNNEEDKGN